MGDRNGVCIWEVYRARQRSIYSIRLGRGYEDYVVSFFTKIIKLCFDYSKGNCRKYINFHYQNYPNKKHQALCVFTSEFIDNGVANA